VAEIAFVVQKSSWRDGRCIEVDVPIPKAEHASTSNCKYEGLFVVTGDRVDDHGFRPKSDVGGDEA